MTRVLVCGGRDFTDRDGLFAELDRLHAERPFSLLIHGAAKGADQLAAEWAGRRGVPLKAYPADWSLGPKAGPIRNKLMLTDGKPDLVVAFRGGRGTLNMLYQAHEAGVEVIAQTVDQ